ncbi:L-lysine exporter family protein LysE/ArgO [Alteribacillus persepolensis]|uniref:L-lysine exporter family protein LysE/ArgO n=1 Tax=Alteribacillus persepolensis TaxID=568899 RepID=A0A1G8EDF3_9BACI|nr:LysE/ArgO family amino acid transporter [Alteribacillus persepolensis]SDH67729.1 L-lysine exporter family protein LysE/ArgO [Alteribacillus persepolensis]
MWEAFFHGFLLSAGLILPLGVQNLFVFNQGVTQPSLYRASPAVFTASICDTILILLAVLGTSFLVDQFLWLRDVLYVAGILFLLYISWVIWNDDPSNGAALKPLSGKQQILFASSVSLLNPHAFLDTFGVIGTNSLLYDDIQQWMFTAASIGVSWLYFFLLAYSGRIIGKLDKHFTWRKRINKISAFMIMAIALYMIIQAM